MLGCRPATFHTPHASSHSTIVSNRLALPLQPPYTNPLQRQRSPRGHSGHGYSAHCSVPPHLACCACTPPATSGTRVASPAGCQAVLRCTHTPALLGLRVKVKGWEVATAGAWRRRQLALLFWPARQEGRWCQHHSMTSPASASRTTARSLAQTADALCRVARSHWTAGIGKKIEKIIKRALQGPRAAGSASHALGHASLLGHEVVAVGAAAGCRDREGEQRWQDRSTGGDGGWSSVLPPEAAGRCCTHSHRITGICTADGALDRGSQLSSSMAHCK